MYSQPEELEPPKGFYKKTREWVSTLDQKIAKRIYARFPFEPTQLRLKPKGINGAIGWHFHPEPPEQFLALIPWGRVWGPHGSVITPNNRLLWDVSFEYNKPTNEHTVFLQKSMPPVTYTSETLAVLTAQCSFNYYHWIFDVLPRFVLLRQAGVEVDRFVITRGPYKFKFPFQDESLSLLGIPKEKLIECDHQTHIKAKTLIVSSMAGYTGHVPKSVCKLLREQFLSKREVWKQDGYERIYISREDAVHRKVLNESEITQLLQKYRFKSIALSTKSLEEKIRLFYSAKIIISPHGAGLSNLVFCNPGTKVIELFSPTYLQPCFYILSNHLHLDYFYLLGEEPPNHNPQRLHSDAILIDLQKLLQTLEMAGI